MELLYSILPLLRNAFFIMHHNYIFPKFHTNHNHEVGV